MTVARMGDPFEREYQAYKMLRIFFKGYDNDTHRVSEEALEDLTELFGLVEEKDRADVYTRFTKLLEVRKVEFDVEQFKVGA